MTKKLVADFQKLFSGSKNIAKGQMVLGSDMRKVERIRCMPSVEYITDGGLPKGKITEFIGPSGGGKSTAAAQTIAINQEEWKRLGEEKVAIWIDLERSANPEYFEEIGVDMESLFILTPNSGEHVIDVLSQAIAKFGESIGIVVVDSLANFTSEKELNADGGDHVIAGQAAVVSRFMRKFAQLADDNGVTLITINQQRVNFDAAQFGPKTKAAAGKAAEYFASMRIEFSRTGNGRKKGDEVISNKVRVKVLKSRFSRPGRVIDTELIFGKGFSRGVDMLEIGEKFNVLSKKSNHSWWYKGEQIGKSKSDTVELLEQDDALFQSVWADIQNAIKDTAIDSGEVEADSADDAPDF